MITGSFPGDINKTAAVAAAFFTGIIFSSRFIPQLSDLILTSQFNGKGQMCTISFPVVNSTVFRNINIFLLFLTTKFSFHIIACPCPHIAAAYNVCAGIRQNRDHRLNPCRPHQLYHLILRSRNIGQHGQLTSLLVQGFKILCKGMEKQGHRKDIYHKK